MSDSWRCAICGVTDLDYEGKDKSLSDHIRLHNITRAEYDCFEINELGSSKMSVELISGPVNYKEAILSFLNQTWGNTKPYGEYSSQEINRLMQLVLSRKTLPTALETMNFTFQIRGVSRACSHQLVRVRIGSGFSQKGMRDFYYGDIDYVTPSSIYAAGMADEYQAHTERCNEFYDKLFAAGVPFQDARFALPHGATTTLSWTVSYLALQNFCFKRLQNHMQWEINSLARLLKKAVTKFDEELGRYLIPSCEVTGKCSVFGNLNPGCGKFPKPDSKDHDFIYHQNQIPVTMRFDEESSHASTEHNQSMVKHFDGFWDKYAKGKIESV